MYESFYGLTGKPFQLNPDPSFYFGSRGHKRAFAYLEYGLYQSEGFIVITGEIGAGKTTIVRSLLEQLDPAKVVAAQLVSTQLDADDLLRAVGVAFGLPVETVDKAVLLASLEAFLCQLATDKKRALLIVDEAQNLTPRAIEELRMLSNFQLGDQALLQSFLVGQPELRDDDAEPADAAAAPAGDRLLPPGPARPGGDAGLHRAPAEARRLEGRSALRAGLLRADPRAHRRHSAPHQHAVQPPAARGVSRREARARQPATCRRSRARSATSWARTRRSRRSTVVGGVRRVATCTDAARMDATALQQALRAARGAHRPPREDRRGRGRPAARAAASRASADKPGTPAGR